MTTVDAKRYGGEAPRADRSAWRAVKNGLSCRCPKCGEGKLFARYAKTVEVCGTCGEEIHHHRADDFPAYIVIIIVGHLIAPMFWAFHVFNPLPMWMNFALWIPLALIATLALLQPVKGAVIGLQWALRMHGFGDGDVLLDDADAHNRERF